MSDFQTKDSGERKVFDSGMQRDTTTGKIKWSLIYDGPILKRYAALLTRGAEKYDPRNWMKATGQEELDRFKDSAARHFAQWMNGELDEDHAAAVVFNINGAEYVNDRIMEQQEAASEGVEVVARKVPETGIRSVKYDVGSGKYVPLDGSIGQ